MFEINRVADRGSDPVLQKSQHLYDTIKYLARI